MQQGEKRYKESKLATPGFCVNTPFLGGRTEEVNSLSLCGGVLFQVVYEVKDFSV